MTNLRVIELKKNIKEENKNIEKSKIKIEWLNKQIQKIEFECDHDYIEGTIGYIECKICGFTGGV